MAADGLAMQGIRETAATALTKTGHILRILTAPSHSATCGPKFAWHVHNAVAIMFPQMD